MEKAVCLIIWDRSGHYHLARAKALQERWPIQIHVADLAASDGLYKWSSCGSKCLLHCLSPKPVEKPDFFRRVVGFLRLLHIHKVRSVAIAGYARPSYLAMLFLCRLFRIKVILFAESWYGKGLVWNLAKGWTLRLVTDSVFVSGERAYRHFRENLRYPDERIVTGYSAVDIAHFTKSEHPPKRRTKMLLCVARFVPEKNLDFLVEAFLVAKIDPEYTLVLVGSGPLGASLRSRGHARICIKDWVHYDDLPNLYSMAEWFVLPSLFEPWGLVVNEAMASGVPVIVSEACGCVPDIVDSSCGFVFNPRCKSNLSRVLETAVATSDKEWTVYSETVRRRVANRGTDFWADQFVKCLSLAGAEVGQ